MSEVMGPRPGASLDPNVADPGNPLAPYYAQLGALHGVVDRHHQQISAPQPRAWGAPPGAAIWPSDNPVGTSAQALPPTPSFEWSVRPSGHLAATPTDDNPLTAGTPSPGQALAYTGQDVNDWRKLQQAEAARLGFADPDTGLPTAKGWANIGQQYAGALIGGTSGPEGAVPLQKAEGETFSSWISRLAGDEKGGGPNPLGRGRRRNAMPEPVPQTSAAPAPPPEPAPAPQPNELQQLAESNPLAGMGRPEAPGEPLTVSTSIISPAVAKKLGIDPYATKDLRVGYERYQDPEASELRERHAGLIKDYGGIVGVHPDMTADEVGKAFLDHLHGNVSGLYNTLVDQWGMPIVRDAAHWYDGANGIVHREAKEWGLEPQQVAGSFASLSPQKDWNQNVLQGRRLFLADSTGLQLGPRGTFTPEMKEWVNNYIQRTLAKESDLSGEALEKKIADERANFDRIAKTPYRDLTTYDDKARWVRAWEQANFPDRSYRLVGPHGEELGFAKTKGGENRAHSWGSFKEIGNALKAMHGDMRQISQAVGGQHKVRSFYNNLISPWSPFGHTTIDTHAIAAALFRPLGSKAKEVAHGLGTSPSPVKMPDGTKVRPPGASGSAPLGISGMYPLFHEAYGRASGDSQLWIPRQMQSITWEGARSLFPDVLKRNKQFQAATHKVWQDAAAGQLSSAEAQAKIIQMASEAMKGEAGRIPLPEWAR